MHWAWKIAKRRASPESVPSFSGVEIQWVHDTAEKSLRAAQDMVNAFGMQNLGIAPALRSRHTEGNAIDMNISWPGTLVINNARGESIEIKTVPRTGMNMELQRVGQSYGINHFRGGNADAPHWSNDGR